MKDKIITILFITFIFLFSLLHIIIKDEKISYTERRELASLPKIEINNKYITKLEDYLLDHFPLRDIFRNIKTKYNYNILKMKDNNGIFIKDNYIYKSNYPTNKDSINNFMIKTTKLTNYLTENNKKYIMIIPDKNYYLNNDLYLTIDYDYIYNEINKLNYEIIDIKDILTINDYYETDTHWKQEKLNKIINKMSQKLEFNYENINYNKETYNNFYGVLYKESGIKRKPETITYLTHSLFNNVTVKYLENEKLQTIYNIDALTGLDSYNIFLDGASSFIEITNFNNKTDKELIIFRDSFGSSLTPLLVNYYKKITVIDNRYINSDNFLKYIKFDNQDVLFAYSTLLINDSYSLKG